MKYYILSLIFVLSLLSSCQDLNFSENTASIETIIVDSSYMSKDEKYIFYDLIVELDKIVSVGTPVDFVFEFLGTSNRYEVPMYASYGGNFFQKLSLPLNEFRIDYDLGYAMTESCKVYASKSSQFQRNAYIIDRFEFILSPISANLPSGSTFNEAISYILSKNSNIKKIKFITNSEVESENILVTNVYMIVNGNTLEIHTRAKEFIADESCYCMFSPALPNSSNSIYLNNIESIDFGNNFNTENVVYMQWMFYECTNLKELNLISFDTSIVTNMYSMFGYCSNLKELDLRNFIFNIDVDIEYIFYKTGSNATNRPISIYVTNEGKYYIQGQGNSSINSNYAVLVSDDETNIEVPDGDEHGEEEWL